MVSADSVLTVLDALEAADVEAVVDGGWGVDALLGRERRPHGDLDLIVLGDQLDRIVGALAPLGYRTALDTLPITTVLAAPRDRRVDLHPTVANDHGDRIQAQRFGRIWANPASTLDGAGVIGGRPVRCLTVQGQVLSHLGYVPDDGDRADMHALAEAFGAGLGLGYARGSDVRVRAAHLDDIAAMTELQLRASVTAYSWPGNEAWAARVHNGDFWRLWQSRIGSPRTWTGVATVGGAIAGTVHVRPWAHEDLDPGSTAELNAAYVDPVAQGEGLGRLLNDAAIEAAARLGYTDLRLHVIEHNTRGQQFWEHLGWARDGVDRELTGAGGMIEHRYISPGTREGGR
ncbi:MAG TPA: GNAT family N-acetyltransferase [Acidimicrobiales bacterium]|nr:GNAT family N-acetyltransferase [Acidimicrobiales bacterium]